MKSLFILAIIGHGLLHLLGPAKAFGLATLPQLTQPIAKPTAMLWLLAFTAMIATAATIPLWPHRWWLLLAGRQIRHLPQPRPLDRHRHRLPDGFRMLTSTMCWDSSALSRGPAAFRGRTCHFANCLA